MRPWLLTLAAVSVIGPLFVSGCEQPGAAPPEASSTSGAPDSKATEPAKMDSTSSDASKTGEKAPDAAKSEEKPADASKTDAPLPDQPKPGDDVAVLETGKGKIVVMFYPTKAPKSVENFKKLVATGFYNGTRFHRCIPGFMVQGGDPKSKDMAKSGEWGTGGNMKDGKEVNVPAEFTDLKHTRGVLSMARSSDPNSASSQFFIMVKDTPSLDGQYSAFGKVVKGLEVADEIVKTGDAGNNGAVDPKNAILLRSAKLAKWPVD